MINKLSICFGILLLVIGVSITTAQEEPPPSLRELADQNDLYIGAAVYTTHLRSDEHQEVLSQQFNMITPENEAKACEVQPELGRFDFRAFDELVAFAEEHDMAVHGHTLVWHNCVPRWLENGDFTREEAIQHLRDHIMTVVGRYKGRIAIWDVVNEAVTDNGSALRDTPWHRFIGDDYVELAFQFAHEADPDALLYYNDFGGEDMGRKSTFIYDMAADFLDRGIPIDGIGMQGHFTMGDINVNALSENMERLGELGLEVQITEMDVRHMGESNEDILREQAGDYYRVMDACVNADNCAGLIVWGVTDKYTWLRGADLDFFFNPGVSPLLFDEGYDPKPGYYAVLDVLARAAGEEAVLSDDEVAALFGRETTTVEIPDPSKSDPAQLAPDSVDGAVYYAAFPVTITLDGETEDWANIPRVTVDSGSMLPENNDTAMTFAAAADDTYLYFLAEVQDSKLVYGLHDPATAWYEEDSVEFYINATGDLTLPSYQEGVAQIAILAANITHPDAPLLGGTNSSDSQIEVFATETADGYRIEAAVPLETDVWSIPPEHLGTLGFQAHLNGSSAESRDTKLIWSVYDTQDQSWSNPSLFGQLIFWDVNQ